MSTCATSFFLPPPSVGGLDLLLRREGTLELCGRGGVGLELLEVGLQIHLLELRQDEVKGAGSP